jgi:uncharacterized RDD family membrane protein YckC
MTVPHTAPPRPLFGTSAEDYIEEVLGCVPGTEQRQRIEMELRSRLDPRLTPEQAIATYGHPREVAELYLAPVELQSAPFFRRLVAALIDIPSVMLTGLLLFYFLWKVAVPGNQSFITAILIGNPIAIGLCFTTLILMSPLYYIVAESNFSQTVGKRLMGLRTVRESGSRITVGQAIVRQIPLFFSGFYLLDAIFALFTRRKQRLFELISKTRVVRA